MRKNKELSFYDFEIMQLAINDILSDGFSAFYGDNVISKCIHNPSEIFKYKSKEKHIVRAIYYSDKSEDEAYEQVRKLNKELGEDSLFHQTQGVFAIFELYKNQLPPGWIKRIHNIGIKHGAFTQRTEAVMVSADDYFVSTLTDNPNSFITLEFLKEKKIILDKSREILNSWILPEEIKEKAYKNLNFINEKINNLKYLNNSSELFN